jgi:heme iron utilization protein
MECALSRGPQARRHLASRRDGVLSTLSARYGGYPFGSLVPYVLDHEARPIILVSRLAEHTRNIAADSRVSLLARDEAPDPQAGARVTLLGNAAPIDASVPAAARYLRFFPEAKDLVALGDFSFLMIAPVAIRFIEGFGSIHWVSATDYAPPANSLAQAEADIVEHMNADHAHNLQNYWRRDRGDAPAQIELLGVDCDGFDLRAGDDRLRIGFEHPVTDASEARAGFVALTRSTRPT